MDTTLSPEIIYEVFDKYGFSVLRIDNFDRGDYAEIRAELWFKDRLSFLPGNTWPERWIIESLQSIDTSELAEQLQIPNQELYAFLDQAMVSGKHNEFHDLSQNLCLELPAILYSMCQWIVKQKQDDFHTVNDMIHHCLP